MRSTRWHSRGHRPGYNKSHRATDLAGLTIAAFTVTIVVSEQSDTAISCLLTGNCKSPLSSGQDWRREFSSVGWLVLMKLILTLIVFVALMGGGMIALSHHDVIARSDLAYKRYLPVKASFSRFRGDSHHLLSVYYRLHFGGKKPPVREAVAFWSLRPFRHVTLVTK